MLKKIAEYYHIEKNVDFARFFGLSEPTAFARMKQGTIDYEAIYAKCPDISPDWLLSRGEGEMLRKDREKAEKANASKVPDAEQDAKLFKLNEKFLHALSNEQLAVTRAQEQISGLIEVLKNR